MQRAVQIPAGDVHAHGSRLCPHRCAQAEKTGSGLVAGIGGGCEGGGNFRLTWLEGWQCLNNALLFVAARLLACEFAIWKGTDLRLTALPLAEGLGAHLVTRLLLFFAFHIAYRLAALSSARCAVSLRTSMFWAHNLALRLVALHAAGIGIKAFATSGAHGLATFWCTHFVALSLFARPCALWCAAVLWGRQAALDLLSAPCLIICITTGELTARACGCGVLVGSIGCGC